MRSWRGYRAVSGATSVAVSDAAPFTGGATNGGFVVLDGAMPIEMSQMQRVVRATRSHAGYATRHVVNAGILQGASTFRSSADACSPTLIVRARRRSR